MRLVPHHLRAPITATALALACAATGAHADDAHGGLGTLCLEQLASPRHPHFIARGDLAAPRARASNSLSANGRSPLGSLPLGDAPDDLVDLYKGTPRTLAECERRVCLRAEAYEAFGKLTEAMKQLGVSPYVASGFRSQSTQCATFNDWISRTPEGFCEVVKQSALPGRSEHQLGTTLDVFSDAWARVGNGNVFRPGFACTKEGTWLREHAWEHGWVLSYRAHPDDRQPENECALRLDRRAVGPDPRTSYRDEAWHLRYIGVDEAAKYHDAWLQSGPGTPHEIALETYLRHREGRSGEADLPVCDGCQCEACATMVRPESGQPTPCGDRGLVIDEAGIPVSATREPVLVEVEATPAGKSWVSVAITIDAAPHTVTQPPIFGAPGSTPGYDAQASYEAFSPYVDAPVRGYADLPGAYRVGIRGAGKGPAFPWRLGFAAPATAMVWNKVNAYLPGVPGRSTHRVMLRAPADVSALEIAILRDGKIVGPVEHVTLRSDIATAGR
jgi:D-alanyl-D-alanine carboxypeptidase